MFFFKQLLMTYKLVQLVLQLNSQLQEEKNPCLLQEYEEQESEQANGDADVNSEANKIDEYNNHVTISME